MEFCWNGKNFYFNVYNIQFLDLDSLKILTMSLKKAEGLL